MKIKFQDQLFIIVIELLAANWWDAVIFVKIWGTCIEPRIINNIKLIEFFNVSI